MPVLRERAGFVQLFLHAGPALARGFLGCSRAAPMRFEADGEMIAVALQRRKLASPINDAASHGGPVIALAVGFLLGVLAMAMANAIFRQEIIAIGIWGFTAFGGVPGIPIEHQRWRRKGGENLG